MAENEIDAYSNVGDERNKGIVICMRFENQSSTVNKIIDVGLIHFNVL